MCSTDYVANATSIKHCRENQPGRASPPARVFVGAYTRRVTPVPIPNTVVKPAGPMILLQRESRSVPAFIKRTPVRKDRGSFFPCPLDGFPAWAYALEFESHMGVTHVTA